MGLWNLELLFCVPVHTDCFCECILKGCGSILQIKLHVAVYLKICICVIVMWNPTSEPQWGKTLIVGSSEGGKYSKLFIETLCLIHATYVIVTLRGAVLIIQNSSEWKFQASPVSERSLCPAARDSDSRRHKKRAQCSCFVRHGTNAGGM